MKNNQSSKWPHNNCEAIPQKILIATNNKGKFAEIKTLLNQINVEAVPSFQFDIEEPEETGSTFAENSLLKAKYYANKTGLFALADDSGLCVEALNNAPGIHSARFAINEKTGKRDFNFACEKIFLELAKKNITREQEIAAHFICNLSLFDPKTNFEISFEGRVDGTLAFPLRGDKGFGYDPIFVKDGMTETFAEIDPELKDKISHRADAFKKLVNWLNQFNKADL